jgi:hypothetical protein
MKLHNRSSGCWLLVVVVIAVGLLPQYVHAADSYLEALKIEADKIDPEGGTDSKSSDPAFPAKGLPPQTVNPAETIKPGLKKEDFEQQLQENYYGSYLFYSTLKKKQRDQVYEEYQKKNDIKSIRDSIMAKLKR